MRRKKKPRTDTAGTETIYLTPGQKLPKPKPGVSQVIVKQEVWAMKVESNTADDPEVIESSEEEPPPSQAVSSTVAAKHPFDEELDYSRAMNVLPDQQAQQNAPLYGSQWQDDQYYATSLDQVHQPQQQGVQASDAYWQDSKPQYHTEETQGQEAGEESAPLVKAEPSTGTDPVVGAEWERRLYYPLEFDSMMRRKFKPKKKDAREEFEKRMKRYPWPTDTEEIDLELEKAPPANLSKAKSADRPPRQCWIRLHRRWLLDNFQKHLFGESNIQYKGLTYASICHHETTPYDCHPLCWQCYYELGLPFCGLDPDIECPHCRIMGEVTTQLRLDKLRPLAALRRKEDKRADEEAKSKKKPSPQKQGTSKSKSPARKEKPTVTAPKGLIRQYHTRLGLPANVYTQLDADEWDRKKHRTEMPNPDWLKENQPVGSCFPRTIVWLGYNLRDVVKENPMWGQPNYHIAVKHQNSLDRSKNIPRTPSDDLYREVPRCLIWGSKQYSEANEEANEGNRQLEKWGSAINKGDVPQQLQAATSTSGVLEKVSAVLAPILEEHLKASSSAASAAPLPSTTEDLLLTLNADDVEQAMQEDPVLAAKALEDVHDVDLLNEETKTAILKRLLDRACKHRELMNAAQESDATPGQRLRSGRR